MTLAGTHSICGGDVVGGKKKNTYAPDIQEVVEMEKNEEEEDEENDEKVYGNEEDDRNDALGGSRVSEDERRIWAQMGQ